MKGLLRRSPKTKKGGRRRGQEGGGVARGGTEGGREEGRGKGGGERSRGEGKKGNRLSDRYGDGHNTGYCGHSDRCDEQCEEYCGHSHSLGHMPTRNIRSARGGDGNDDEVVIDLHEAAYIRELQNERNFVIRQMELIKNMELIKKNRSSNTHGFLDEADDRESGDYERNAAKGNVMGRGGCQTGTVGHQTERPYVTDRLSSLHAEARVIYHQSNFKVDDHENAKNLLAKLEETDSDTKERSGRREHKDTFDRRMGRMDNDETESSCYRRHNTINSREMRQYELSSRRKYNEKRGKESAWEKRDGKKGQMDIKGFGVEKVAREVEGGGGGRVGGGGGEEGGREGGEEEAEEEGKKEKAENEEVGGGGRGGGGRSTRRKVGEEEAEEEEEEGKKEAENEEDVFHFSMRMGKTGSVDHGQRTKGQNSLPSSESNCFSPSPDQ